MVLHYFKKKENIDQEISKKIYLSIIKYIDFLYLNKKLTIKKDFNTSFEITTLLIFVIFFSYKNQKFKEIHQNLIDNFVFDLDYSLRNLGISDLKIGKYVKKYVNKIYFRIKELEIIFTNNDFNKFEKLISKFHILEKKGDLHLFSQNLYNILNKFMNIAKTKDISLFSFYINNK